MTLTINLYHGDCLEVINELDLSIVDAVVITDPPYGIDYDPKRYNASTTTDSVFEKIKGDDAQFDPRPWLEFPTVILWGANNYTRHLPRSGWLCWDKRCSKRADRMFGSPFELAWIRCGQRDRIFKIARIQHGGVVNADGVNHPRVHPTQKPIVLMEWCLEIAGVSPGDTVLDPFMGCGTMGLACLRHDVNFIGVEIDDDYFNIAKQRVAAEELRLSQMRLSL